MEVEKNRTKAEINPTGQTLSPVAICLASVIPSLWPYWLQSIQPLLGWFHLQPVAFLGRHSMFLGSPTYWGLHWSPDFSPLVSWSTLSGSYGRGSDPVIQFFLASLAFLWIWVEAPLFHASLHDSCILHAYKISGMSIMPRLSFSMGSSQTFLSDSWVWWNESWGSNSLSGPC